MKLVSLRARVVKICWGVFLGLFHLEQTGTKHGALGSHGFQNLSLRKSLVYGRMLRTRRDRSLRG